MKTTNFIYFVLIIFMLISCSSPLDSIDNSLSIEPSNSKLKIINSSNETIFLFVVEQKVAASINWTPHFGDPKVLKNSSTTINYSEIYKGSNEPVSSGDKVIIYYWDSTNKSDPKIFNKVIEL